jgi:hypothetical protein
MFSFINRSQKGLLLLNSKPSLSSNNNLYQGNIDLNKVIGNGLFYSSCLNAVMLSGLFIAPEAFSKWENKKERIKLKSIRNQYEHAYTTPPVIDHDLWITNYIGHPYQGSFYYNSVRCQGASILQSSLFTLVQTFLWEYVWEASIEQPSIQDLITTPLGGIIIGELINYATIAMSEHGITWYKIAIICVINPAYISNNRFRFTSY